MLQKKSLAWELFSNANMAAYLNSILVDTGAVAVAKDVLDLNHGPDLLGGVQSVPDPLTPG